MSARHDSIQIHWPSTLLSRVSTEENMNKEYGGTVHNAFTKGVLNYEPQGAMSSLSGQSQYITSVVVGSIVIPRAINIADSSNKDKAKIMNEDASLDSEGG